MDFYFFYILIRSQIRFTNPTKSQLLVPLQKVSPAVASINVVQLREYSTNSMFDDPFFRIYVSIRIAS